MSFVALGVSVVNFFIAIFWGGFVLSQLWLWFLVPLGIIPVTYLQAVGVSFVVQGFLGLRGAYPNVDPKNVSPALHSITMTIASWVYITLLLGVAWIFHTWFYL